MADRACVKRLQKEYRALCKEPVSHVTASPNPNDILEWHYILEGSKGTAFEGGVYYGKLKFLSEYPFKPPSISMITPNGRFATQKRLCMSMSDFHPESWNPMWSVSSILTGLLSFMMDTSPTTGSISTTVVEKKRLAEASLAFNCQNPMFRKLFPEYVEKYEEKQKLEKQNKEDSIEEEERKDGSLKVDAAEKGRNQRVQEAKNNQPLKQVPFWLVLFILSILSAVMALPLLQI